MVRSRDHADQGESKEGRQGRDPPPSSAETVNCQDDCLGRIRSVERNPWLTLGAKRTVGSIAERVDEFADVARYLVILQP